MQKQDEKNSLHPRNRFRKKYDFKKLMTANPDLASFVTNIKNENQTINFFNPSAVLALNKALLVHHYDVKFWEIPPGHLCPPIPGRLDYIHYAADLLEEKNNGKIPKGKQIKCWDIGVGANCIYPILGNQEYGWNFVGSDVNGKSIENCNNIITKNTFLENNLQVRLQSNPKYIFKNIIKENEYFDLAICNPPFHSSKSEAEKATLRKLKNLTSTKQPQKVLNFGGKNNELWYEGGEVTFIKNIIEESADYRTSFFWLTTLVSKKSNLKKLNSFLQKAEATEIKVINMAQGNKTSQILAWTFLSPKQQKIWIKTRWG